MLDLYLKFIYDILSYETSLQVCPVLTNNYRVSTLAGNARQAGKLTFFRISLEKPENDFSPALAGEAGIYFFDEK